MADWQQLAKWSLKRLYRVEQLPKGEYPVVALVRRGLAERDPEVEANPVLEEAEEDQFVRVALARPLETDRELKRLLNREGHSQAPKSRGELKDLAQNLAGLYLAEHGVTTALDPGPSR